MTDTFVYVINGLDTLEAFNEKAGSFKIEAIQALNKVARDSRKDAADRIRQQVAFEQSYLSPSSGRLVVAKQATRTSPEAVIRARGRPTSLARFVTAGSLGKQGVHVRVKPGSTEELPKAFLMKLRAGQGTETKHNMGLAVRLKPGVSMRNRRWMTKIASNLYLLYGPSVSQVFIDSQKDGVAKEMEPEILEQLADEIRRLMELK